MMKRQTKGNQNQKTHKAKNFNKDVYMIIQYIFLSSSSSQQCQCIPQYNLSSMLINGILNIIQYNSQQVLKHFITRLPIDKTPSVDLEIKVLLSKKKDIFLLIYQFICHKNNLLPLIIYMTEDLSMLIFINIDR